MILVSEHPEAWFELDLETETGPPTGDATTDADLALVAGQMVEALVDWGFAYVPDPAVGVLCTASVRWEPAGASVDLDDVTERLVMPEPLLVAPPEVSRRTTPLGEALRVLQMPTTPASDLTESVVAALAWAWLVLEDDGEPTLLTVSTVVHDLDRLEQVEQAVDQLAAGLSRRTA